MPREKLNNTLENLFDFYHGHSNAAQQQDEGIQASHLMKAETRDKRGETCIDVFTLQEASHYAEETRQP